MHGECAHVCMRVCMGQRSTLRDLPQQAFPLPLRGHFSLVGQELPGSHSHPPASTSWWGTESMCHCTRLLMWVLTVDLGSSHFCATWASCLPSLNVTTAVPSTSLSHDHVPYSIYATSTPPTTKAFLETGSCSVAHAGPEFANQTNEDHKVAVSLRFLPSPP